MKKKILIACIFIVNTGVAQNVGIGTNNPITGLHVADSSVLFSTSGTSASGTGFMPANSTGRKMLWFAPKAAFRAGYASANVWDNDSIGLHSFATGNSTLAKGQYSFASGFQSKASGLLSTAMGNSSVASGDYSIAIGNYCVASGQESIALGGSKSYGRGSRSLGYGATASGDFSISLGDGSFSEGMSATATGLATHASGQNSFASGSFTTASAENTFAGGAYSVATANCAFSAGANSTASGITSFAMGNFAYATGNASTAMGFSVFSKAKGSATVGQYNDITDSPSGSTEATTDRIFQVGNGLTNTTRTNAITVLRNGNTGIGIIAPTQRLHVAGNILATGTITPSDIRYKINIQPIEDPLQKVEQINGVTYQYRADEFADKGFDKTTQVGLIAQDVEKVFPQLVFTDDNGYKAVDYTKLIPLLIEGMKAQQKQIEILQDEVTRLKAGK